MPNPKTNILEQILRRLGRDRLTLENTKDAAFHPETVRALEDVISRSEEIRFILPAFPCKSANREKTASDSVDLGEFLAIRKLQRLCDAVTELHAPGAKLTLCSDGRVFNDLVLVSDENVDRYREEIHAIIKRHQFDRIEWFDLDAPFPNQPNETKRRHLVENYGLPLDSIAHDHLFNGIHRFVFEDRVSLIRDRTRNQIRKESVSIAKSVIQRSNAWSNYLKAKFPGSIRLSIHPQPMLSPKVGIRLMPSENPWATPWHNAVLVKDNTPRLVKHHAIRAQGGTEKRFQDYLYYEA